MKRRKKSIFCCCRSCWSVMDFLKTKMERNTICEYSANNGTKGTQFNKGKSTWIITQSALHWRRDGNDEHILDFILSSIDSYQNEELHHFLFCPQTCTYIFYWHIQLASAAKWMAWNHPPPNQNERCSNSMFKFDLITEWRKRRSKNSAM